MARPFAAIVNRLRATQQRLMRRLETEARPLLSPILRGDGRELPQGGQGDQISESFTG